MSPLERRLKKTIEFWLPILSMRDWEITIEMTDDEICEGPIRIDAETYPSYEYEVATMRFCVPHIVGLTDYQLHSLCIHELLHCILDEARIENAPSEEHITTLLTRALLRQAPCQS